MSKVIANRLKHVIGEVIGETQTGFIQGRFFHDGILTARESIHWLKKKRKKENYLRLTSPKPMIPLGGHSLIICLNRWVVVQE